MRFLYVGAKSYNVMSLKKSGNIIPYPQITKWRDLMIGILHMYKL